MRRRTLLRQLAEGLALLAGHQACRAAGLPAAAPTTMPQPLPKPLAPASELLAQAGPPATNDAGALALDCDLAAPPLPLRHPWRHCVGSCHAPLALRADWQQQLARARRELGFRHVRFHGLLSDDMGTLITQDDRFLFSFFNIDRVFDFLLSIGMRPVVELSFMPWNLASGNETVFRYRGNVTPPRRMADWTLLVTTLVGHWVERYGVDEVAQWPLEVWNEPNLVFFWTGSQQQYFELYEATWRAVKSVSPRLQVGGPATAANGWLPEFMAWTAAHACAPDFVSTHYYPTDAFGAVDTDTVAQLAHAPLGVMRERALEARAAAGAKPLYYTEWNITSNPRDPLHDGPFCAALAARYLLDVDATVDGYSWWTFSDIFEENYFPSTPYHGGFGLLNLYGVPKPVYRGFELVARLGTRHWPVATSHPTVAAWVGSADAGGDGSAAGVDLRGDMSADKGVGKSEDGSVDGAATAVLLVNVAPPRHPIATELVTLRLAGTRGRRPRAAQVWRVDDAHANPRAAWERMGRPEYPHPHQVAALEAASAPLPEPLAVTGDATHARFTLALPANAMALVRIEWERPA